MIAPRWLSIPAVLALVLITPHAVEDDGFGAWPWVALLAVTVAQMAGALRSHSSFGKSP